jgi:deoxyribose-phosphate aldolase
VSDAELARLIDHTLLKPGSTVEQIDRLCDEAREHGFFSVCVHPVWVGHCAARLAEGPVKVCTVVGFPLGETLSEAKAAETAAARRAGADEIDMVVARSAVSRADWDAVEADVRAVVEAADGALVKVILETAELSPEQIREASLASVRGGADFVKTSTGFGAGGASVEAVRLMREAVGPEVGVKASGGIRDAKTARAMTEAGATRLGCSAGVAIVGGSESDADY